MIWALRLFFVVVLVGMTIVTVRASLVTAVWQLPPTLTGDLWFQATLADAYFGFLTFYAWVFYKERAAAARTGWLVAILLLGNFAMATYALLQLSRVPAHASLADVLVRKEAA